MVSYFDGTSWIWGLSLIAATLAVHITGVVMTALSMVKIRVWAEGRGFSFEYMVSVMIGAVAVSGLVLVFLHGIEAAMWAVAYVGSGAVPLPVDAMYFSVDSITTRGASGIVLERHWQMMGALEAVDGMLLFGISTAYIFVVLQAYWPMLSRRQ